MSIKNMLCAKFIWLPHMGPIFDKDLVKQALSNILQRNNVLLLKPCIIKFSRKCNLMFI